MFKHHDIEEEYFKEAHQKKLVLDTNITSSLEFSGFESSFSIPERVDEEEKVVEKIEPVLVTTTISKLLNTPSGKSLFE